MNFLLLLSFNTLLLTQFIIVKCNSLLNLQWKHHMVLEPNGKYDLMWSYDHILQRVTFKADVETRGWIGFGISPNGAMTGSDLIIAWVDETGNAHFHDRYAGDEELPFIDESQDWNLIHASENSTHTSVIFMRPLVTCDYDYDLPITSDTMKIIWAFDTDDPSTEHTMSKHKAHYRGSRSVHLLSEPPLDEIIIKEGEQLNTWDIVSNHMPIPNNSATTYWCKIVKVPFKDKRHVVKIEPIISPLSNAPFVHHMVLYRCLHPNPSVMDQYNSHGGANCFDFANMPIDFAHCQSVYMVWATGGDAFTLPENIGLPLADDDNTFHFLFEIHYDNPELIGGKFDSSGLRLWHTDVLRKYDADTATMGSVADYRLIIPPKEENVTVAGHCHSNCFREKMPPSGINVIASLPHGHRHARKIKVRHFRNDTELPPIVEENNYDFNFQDFRHIPGERVILPNDMITVECTYNTMKKDVPLFGGLSTNEEMCMVFLIYYPQMKSTRACLSGLTPQTVMKLADVSLIKSADNNDMNPIIVLPSNYSGERLMTYVLSKTFWDPQLMNESRELIRYAPQRAQCYWRQLEDMENEEIEELIQYPKIVNTYNPPEVHCQNMVVNVAIQWYASMIITLVIIVIIQLL